MWVLPLMIIYNLRITVVIKFKKAYAMMGLIKKTLTYSAEIVL